MFILYLPILLVISKEKEIRLQEDIDLYVEWQENVTEICACDSTQRAQSHLILFEISSA